MTAWCAICADDQTTDLQIILLDGKHIAACLACRTEHPRSGRYDFNGGVPDRRGYAHTTNKQGRKGGKKA